GRRRPCSASPPSLRPRNLGLTVAHLVLTGPTVFGREAPSWCPACRCPVSTRACASEDEACNWSRPVSVDTPTMDAMPGGREIGVAQGKEYPPEFRKEAGRFYLVRRGRAFGLENLFYCEDLRER